MDILGIGGWELVAILLIMLVVAGPKRMIQWSYTAGKYVSQLRKMWAETAEMIQKEFDEAGVDVKVPQDIPTRQSINREIGRALTPVTKPLQTTMDAARKEIETTQKSIDTAAKGVPPKPVVPSTPAPVPPAAPNPASNGHPSGESASFGTWSQPAPPSEPET